MKDQNPSETSEVPPPSYTSCVTNNASLLSGFDQFVRIVGNLEKLHFHAPNGMGYCTVPEVVQIRDSTEKPILCIMTGQMVVASGGSRVLSSRAIMTPSGEGLISISPGTVYQNLPSSSIHLILIMLNCRSKR